MYFSYSTCGGVDSYMPSDRGVGILKQLDDIAVAAEEFMAREGRNEWTHDSDGESYAEEDLPEVRDVTAEERAAGPPLAVGDEVTFVAATAGDYEDPNHRTMRVFADSHVLYE